MIRQRRKMRFSCFRTCFKSKKISVYEPSIAEEIPKVDQKSSMKNNERKMLMISLLSRDHHSHISDEYATSSDSCITGIGGHGRGHHKSWNRGHGHQKINCYLGYNVMRSILRCVLTQDSIWAEVNKPSSWLKWPFSLAQDRWLLEGPLKRSLSGHPI